MKGIMITSDNCEPCIELKEQFSDLLATGEIEEVNAEKQPDRVLKLMEKYPVGIPSLLILSDEGELVISI